MNTNKTIVVGIDLGTTYSCVAYVDDSGNPVVIPNKEGERTTPSVVCYGEEPHVKVGKEAKELTPLYPTQVASFIKRKMGDDYYYFECKAGKLRPVEISRHILEKLVKDASEKLGQEIKNAVITCPAYFFVKEREATKKAAQLAGLNVLEILDEPVAAAISYGIANNVDRPKNVLVYDLGGGTFDATLIRVEKDRIETICKSGDHLLGGKDWDERLVQLLIKKIQEESSDDDQDLISDHECYEELRLLAETMKKDLTEATTTRRKFAYAGKKFQLSVSLEEFEEITKDLVYRTLDFIDSVLEDAKKKGIYGFDELLLVGGSSKMVQVKKALSAKFGVTPRIFDPDEAVAKGAAIVGNNAVVRAMLEEKVKLITKNPEFTLKGESKDNDVYLGVLEEAKNQLQLQGITNKEIENALKKIINVSSKTFGTLSIPHDDVVKGNTDSKFNRLFNLIYRNTALPAETVYNCCTIFQDQTSVHFAVLENLADPPEPEDTETFSKGLDPSVGIVLWEGDLPLPPGLPAGAALEVIFKMSSEGLLDVTCRHPDSGKSIHTVITTEATLSREEEQEIERRNANLIID